MRGTDNRAALEAFLDAQKAFTTLNRDRFVECVDSYTTACTLDPTFARAHGGLAYAYVSGVLDGLYRDEENDNLLERAEELALKAVALDPDDYANHWDLAFVYIHTARMDEGLSQYERALDLFDNHTDLLDRKPGLLLEMGEALVYAGRTMEGVQLMERAVNQVPDWYRWHLAFGYYFAREHQRVMDELGKMFWHPGDPRYLVEVELLLAASHAFLGNAEASRAARNRFVKVRGPDWPVEKKLERFHFQRAKDRAHWLEGMRKAGFYVVS